MENIELPMYFDNWIINSQEKFKNYQLRDYVTTLFKSNHKFHQVEKVDLIHLVLS